MLAQNGSSLIQVSNQGDQSVVDSRLIAAQLQITHKAFAETVRKYKTEMEQEFGCTAFKTADIPMPKGGVRHEIVCYFLNEDQALYIMSLSRNTDAVRKCKRELVKAFSQAKKIIPQQNDRIRELELEVKLREMDNSMLAMHGKETVLTLRGKSDQMVEVDRPTLEVIDGCVKYVGQTLAQIKETAFKKFGIRFKSGADIKRFLESHGCEGLIGQTPRKVLTDYVPIENLEEVYKILQDKGHHQLLLGE